jgi:hypothetical protein
MTPPQSFFTRPEGGGWLILCGGPADDATLARAAALVQQAGSLLVLSASAASREAVEMRLLECNVASGLPGEVVPLMEGASADDRLGEAAFIVIPDITPPAELASVFEETGSGEVLLSTLEAGAVVLAEGRSAEAIGEIIEAEVPTAGSGWLRNAIIQSHFTPGTGCRVLVKRPTMYRLGLGEHAALALGPQGEVEVWGEPAPTVTLGAVWTR